MQKEQYENEEQMKNILKKIEKKKKDYRTKETKDDDKKGKTSFLKKILINFVGFFIMWHGS